MKLTIVFVILYCVYEVNSFNINCEFILSKRPKPPKGRGLKPSVAREKLYVCNLDSDNDSTEINIQHLPDKSDEDVKSLSIRLQSLKFPISICEKFINLEKLKMTDLADVDEGAFKRCKALRTLTLQFNENFREVKAILSDFEDLESFSLNHSPFETFNVNLFESNSKLQALNLNFNELQDLPEGIFDNLIHLLRLELMNNELKTLNANLFKNLRKVTLLFLQNNKLEELPANIFSSMESLETLFISDNKLTTLNYNSFGSFANFRVIRIHNNQINSIDEAIFENNDNLGDLSVYSNPCVEGVVSSHDSILGYSRIREILKKCYDNYKNEN